MPIIAGNLYKLKTPLFRTSPGQGAPPTGITIREGENSYLLPWEQVFKASETIETVADFSVSGYPLIKLSFAERISKQLEEII